MWKRLVVLFALGLVGIAVQVAAQTSSGPGTTGRSVCVPYDPAGLKLVEIEHTGTWRLQRDDGAIFQQFTDRDDAQEGLEVARRHTQICYNVRPNRQDYVMTYWK